MWYGLTHLFHSLVSQVHIRHMCGATPSPMVCFRMVIYIWLHNQLTTTVELISSNGLLLAHLVEAAHVCDDDVAAFLLVPAHADEKFTDVAPAVRGVASSCVEDLAFPGEGGVESPCRLVKSYTLAGVQHMCGTSNPPPSASRAVAAFQPQCADPLAAVFLRRLCERPTGR